jgi:hypothetical protein
MVNCREGDIFISVISELDQFARLDAEGQLVWVCYLSEHNPFDKVVVAEERVTATSTSGLTITVDLDAPVG